jgi:hypothetical protein
MTDPINDTFTKTASAIGEADDQMFETIFNELCKRDLRNVSTIELAFALGVSTGTIIKLRRRIEELEKRDD